jgi:hypothetical protein
LVTLLELILLSSRSDVHYSHFAMHTNTPQKDLGELKYIIKLLPQDTKSDNHMKRVLHTNMNKNIRGESEIVDCIVSVKDINITLSFFQKKK